MLVYGILNAGRDYVAMRRAATSTNRSDAVPGFLSFLRQRLPSRNLKEINTYLKVFAVAFPLAGIVTSMSLQK